MQINDIEAEEKSVGAMSNTPAIAERQFCASGNAVNVHLWMRDRYTRSEART
jgi:hypothetical protein